MTRQDDSNKNYLKDFDRNFEIWIKDKYKIDDIENLNVMYFFNDNRVHLVVDTHFEKFTDENKDKGLFRKLWGLL